MITMKNARSLIFVFVVLISVGSQITAQEVKTIKIDPTKNSIDTGVRLQPGDMVEVTQVTGKIWVSGPGNGPGGVDYTGSPNIPNIPGAANSYQYSKATPHSLVAYVGNMNNHYQVRKSILQTATVAGNLFLGFNDNMTMYGDNKGGWDVTYKIIRKAEVCNYKSGPQLKFTWTNKTGAPITVSWVNFKCQDDPPKTVQPNATYDGLTYIGHMFRIRDERTKEEIGFITVEQTSAKVDILKKGIK